MVIWAQRASNSTRAARRSGAQMHWPGSASAAGLSERLGDQPCVLADDANSIDDEALDLVGPQGGRGAGCPVLPMDLPVQVVPLPPALLLRKRRRPRRVRCLAPEQPGERGRGRPDAA